jgi:hypothetical protein
MGDTRNQVSNLPGIVLQVLAQSDNLAGKVTPVDRLGLAPELDVLPVCQPH